MIEKRLNLSLELLRTVAAISHILPWSEYWIYTLLLSQRDPHTLRVRVDQKEIARATGYGERSVKYGVANLTALDLIRKWRGPQSNNYYQFVLPLSNTVVEKIREHLPTFSRELEVSAKRKRGSKKVSENTVVTPEDKQEAPFAHDEFQGIPDEEQPCISKEEQKPVAETLESSGPALDPQISALLDNLERRPVRNSAIHFLASIGFVEPQLSLEQKTVVDREGLLVYLVEHEADTVVKFCELIQTYTESPDRTQLPTIDVPIMDPITLRIYRKLDLYPCGIQWLRKVAAWKDCNGIPLSDGEIRRNLYEFMRENGIMTFDSLIASAKTKHCEAVGKKPIDYVQPEQFGLGGYVN